MVSFIFFAYNQVTPKYIKENIDIGVSFTHKYFDIYTPLHTQNLFYYFFYILL